MTKKFIKHLTVRVHTLKERKFAFLLCFFKIKYAISILKFFYFQIEQRWIDAMSVPSASPELPKNYDKYMIAQSNIEEAVVQGAPNSVYQLPAFCK